MRWLWQGATRIFRTESLVLLSSHPILIPYYHVISDDHLPHIRPLYAHRGVMRFEQDIEALAQQFVPITLQELIAHVRSGQPMPRPALLLTFDDGLRECADIVAPLLARKGLPAAFFLNTAFMDNAALMFRHQAALLLDKLQQQPALRAQATAALALQGKGSIPPEVAIREMGYHQQEALQSLAEVLEVSFADYLATRQPYMRWQQALDMQKLGFEFGAHSIDHPHMRRLLLDEQLHQVRQSMDEVQQRLQLDYRAFAFPFTDRFESAIFMRKLVTGIEPLADITFGTSGLRQDVHPACRQRVDLETPRQGALLLAKTLMLKFAVRKLTFRKRLPRK